MCSCLLLLLSDGSSSLAEPVYAGMSAYTGRVFATIMVHPVTLDTQEAVHHG